MGTNKKSDREIISLHGGLSDLAFGSNPGPSHISVTLPIHNQKNTVVDGGSSHEIECIPIRKE
jgi:hypothetical protein